MQDRFKFRVWDKENKCMHYPTRYSNFTIVNGTIVKIESYPIANSAYLGKRIALEFDEAVIVQCTGLKDKNGKLIYEGDILKLAEFGKPVEVKHRALGFVLRREPSNTVGYDNDKYIPEDCEVIGNIYKNPELLEKK